MKIWRYCMERKVYAVPSFVLLQRWAYARDLQNIVEKCYVYAQREGYIWQNIYGKIIKSKDGYVIRNTISNLDNGESKPIISETIFIYEGDNIKVISGGKSRVIEKVSKEEFLNR